MARREGLLTTPAELVRGLARVNLPLYVVDHGDTFAFSHEGTVELGGDPQVEGLPLLALAPVCKPQRLGSAGFARDHGVRFCYLAGAMANGIGSVELVEAMSRAGMLSFFGAAGLGPDPIEDAIDHISTRLGDLPWGFNLIHSPYEPRLEEVVADLYVRRGCEPGIRLGLYGSHAAPGALPAPRDPCGLVGPGW